MIAITSISPGHKNYDSQKIAIKSWIENGYKPISLNSLTEIDILSKSFPEVEFVETRRTNEKLFGKPYVLISAIIDYAKTLNHDYFLIINSDIIIKDSYKIVNSLIHKSETGVIIINRFDVNHIDENGKRYDLGFDGFFLNKKWLDIFPQSILCLGQCFWDFWLPFQCVLSKTPIYKVREPYLFHVRHAVQYSSDDWIATGKIFEGEVGVLDKKVLNHRDVGRMSNYVYERIKNNLR